MSRTLPPPLPDHLETRPPPRQKPVPAPYQVPRVKTPQEEVNAELRANVIWTAIFVSLMVLVQWASRRPALSEVVNEVGCALLMLADLVLIVMITLEPFYLKRKASAAAAVQEQS